MSTDSITINCPSCGVEIPLSEALTQQLEAQIQAKFDAKQARLEAKLAQRAADLEAREAALERDVEAAVAARISELKSKAEGEAAEKVRKDLSDLQAQLDEAKAKRKVAEEAELALRKEKRELEEERDGWELQKTRQLEEERKTIREHEAQVAAEATRQQIAERDLKIKQLSEQAELMKRKADQGSVQLQGEALELELQAALTCNFKSDDIVEVKKGQRGGDWLQHVRPTGGSRCGTILWEAKRAQNWGTDWIAKAKRDAADANAAFCIIVSDVLPKGVEHFGDVEGVWVTLPGYAVALASALRCAVIEVAAQRRAIEGRGTKAEGLWDYVTGPCFKARVAAAMEAYADLVKDHEAEKRAALRRWAKREKAHQRLVENIVGIHGDVQGLGGREVPEIEDPEVLALEDGAAGDEEVA